MKTKARGILSASLALVIVFALMAPAVSALDFSVGDELVGGEVTAFEEKTLGTGLTYSKTTYTDAGERDQVMYALEFNPKTSDFMPVVYSRYTGTGASAYNGAVRLESDYEMDVYAGVNATFYSMDTGSTYAGYWVHDGRLAQAEYGLQNDIIAFTSDGEMQIVNSKLTFDVYFNGRLVTYNGSNSLAYINKCSLATNVSNLFYYWDTECGTKTDSKIEGVEIVCEKLNGGELGIERTLTGKIVEIRPNSKNSAVGANQFVLYVKNDSPLKDAIEGTYKVGDTVSIRVNEEVEASKAVTSAAVTALAAQYKIVENGEYAPAADTLGLGSAFLAERAQRTSIGVKADGSLVIVCTAGRSNASGPLTSTMEGTAGLTVPELGALMADLGCVMAYMLDGGGSTQMITKAENEDSFTQWSGNTTTSGAFYYRPVANCLYIVKRPTDNTEALGNLNYLISAVEEKKIETDEAKAALASAKALLTAEKLMEGDILRESMKLQNILDAGDELADALAACEGIITYDYSPSALGTLRAAYDVASKLNVNTNDSETILNAARALKTAVGNKGEIGFNVTAGKDYTAPVHYPATDSYGDSGGELTDMIIDPKLDSSAEKTFVAFKMAPAATDKFTVDKITIDGVICPYVDVIVDLDKETENIKEFVAYTTGGYWGIGYCYAVEYAVSSDSNNWTVAGTVKAEDLGVSTAADIEGELNFPLVLDEGLNGRYIRVRLLMAQGSGSFVFISELQAFAYEDTMIGDVGYVTDTNKTIGNNDAVIFTPDFGDALTKDNGNSTWAYVVVAEASGSGYKVTAVYSNPGNAGTSVAIPANGFVYAVHTDTENVNSKANRAYAESAKVGQYILLDGVDLSTGALLPGAYIRFTGVLNEDAAIAVDDETGYLTGLTPGMTEDEVKAQFVSPEDVVISGASKDGVGTGAQITFNGQTWTAVLIGDLNGDAKITATDYLLAKKSILKLAELDEVQTEAFKLGETTAPSASNYLKLKKHVLKLADLFA